MWSKISQPAWQNVSAFRQIQRDSVYGLYFDNGIEFETFVGGVTFLSLSHVATMQPPPPPHTHIYKLCSNIPISNRYPVLDARLTLVTHFKYHENIIFYSRLITKKPDFTFHSMDIKMWKCINPGFKNF